MDQKLEISLLYDFYGALMPESQQRVVELYVNDDLSLSEVADILSISRQGVRDSLKRACEKLRGYEKKLGLLAAFREREKLIRSISADAEAIRGLSDDKEIHSKCDDILALCEKTA